jgi:hypothetical protein
MYLLILCDYYVQKPVLWKGIWDQWIEIVFVLIMCESLKTPIIIEYGSFCSSDYFILEICSIIFSFDNWGFQSSFAENSSLFGILQFVDW